MDNCPTLNASTDSSNINIDNSKRTTFEITKVTSTSLVNHQNSADEISDSYNESKISIDDQMCPSMNSELSRPSSEDTMYSPREGSPILSMLLAATAPVISGLDNPKEIDQQSRFRLVKIQNTEPVHRGRWTCHYYKVPETSLRQVATNNEISKNNEQLRDILHDDKLSNDDALVQIQMTESDQTNKDVHRSFENESQCTGTLLPEDIQQRIHEVDGGTPVISRLLSSNTRPKFDLEDNIETQLLDMQGFSANSSFSEIGGASAAAIDSKIAQAMDLVKSHLMFAVHEEIELLKTQIKDLVERNNQLELENNILRSAAPPETLLRLKEFPQIPPHS